MAAKVNLPQQLLEQARHLASRDRKGPLQANLRRASSTAYYALFHFLIEETCRGLLGPARSDRRL